MLVMVTQFKWTLHISLVRQKKQTAVKSTAVQHRTPVSLLLYLLHHILGHNRLKSPRDDTERKAGSIDHHHSFIVMISSDIVTFVMSDLFPQQRVKVHKKISKGAAMWCPFSSSAGSFFLVMWFDLCQNVDFKVYRTEKIHDNIKEKKMEKKTSRSEKLKAGLLNQI